MTLREMVESIGIDEEPLECSFCIAAFLRTLVQKEPSTLEGECRTLLGAGEKYGRMNDPSSVRRWLAALEPVPDAEVPDDLWLSICNAADEDEGDAGP